MDLLSVLGLFIAMVTFVECQDAKMNQNIGQGTARLTPQGASPPSLHDKKHIQDPNHVKEHYDGVLDAQENYTEDELSFHYFKVHDYNNDNKLDGIELISALTHYHGSKDGAQPDQPTMPDLELANMIDVIMEDDDTNRDGYIDYPEFIMSQNR